MRVRALLVVLAVIVLCVAASGQSSTVISACAGPNGSLRIAGSGGCRSNETSLSWNQQGPSGPAGPAGADGATGPEGPSGPAGTVLPLVHYTEAGQTPSIPADQTVYARLVLPRGQYSATAIATVSAIDGTGVTCWINAELNGATNGLASGYLYGPLTSVLTGQIPLMADTLGEVDGFSVSCSSTSPVNSVMNRVRLRAIPVAAVDYQYGNVAPSGPAQSLLRRQQRP